MSDLALSESQHAELSRISNGFRTSTRPDPKPDKPRRYPGVVRVIAPTDRLYNSTTTNVVPVFGYDSNKWVWNIEMVGSALAGYLVLIINNNEYTLECRRETLEDLVTAVPELKRATVLPGLWELEFSKQVTVGSRSLTGDEDNTLCELFDDINSVMFNGAVIVRQEYWCTIPDADGNPDTVETQDAIPYQQSTVPAGAIGIAVWAWDAGYIVTAWGCRRLSFSEDYEQSTDPVPLM
jgi:hypothetical protein